MISAGALIHAVVCLIVFGLIWWLLWWLLNYINPPEPFKKIAVAAVLICIAVLLSLVGHPLVVWP